VLPPLRAAERSTPKPIMVRSAVTMARLLPDRWCSHLRRWTLAQEAGLPGSALQGGGRWFDPTSAHRSASVVAMAVCQFALFWIRIPSTLSIPATSKTRSIAGVGFLMIRRPPRS
jgi:hypothetical protein